MIDSYTSWICKANFNCIEFCFKSGKIYFQIVLILPIKIASFLNNVQYSEGDYSTKTGITSKFSIDVC